MDLLSLYVKGESSLVHKKKFLTMFLSMFFVICVGFSLKSSCKAINSYYNLTGENLKRIYLFGKQQSIDNFPTERSDYNSLLIQWEHWDTFSGDINWDLMASNFNDFIYNSSSGDNNPTRTYSDDNLICFCMPGNYLDNSTDRPLVFMFIQYNTRTIKLTESYSNNTYNETMSIVNSSGDAVNYALPYKYYYIKVFSNRVDYGNSTNDSSLDYNFLSYYRGKFSNYIDLNEMYAYGLLNLYRTDTIGDGYKWIYYKPYNGNDVNLYRMYYQMNLDLNEVYAGDIPTPTPEPTEEPSEDTNELISDINNTLTDVPGSGDFEIPSSGEIVGAFSDFQISDPTDNFWSFLLTGLQAALINNVRYLEFDFLGETYVLDNQAYSITSIPLLYELVTTACIVGFIVVEFSFIHHLVVYISTLDLDIILKRLRAMDISDIFK